MILTHSLAWKWLGIVLSMLIMTFKIVQTLSYNQNDLAIIIYFPFSCDPRFKYILIEIFELHFLCYTSIPCVTMISLLIDRPRSIKKEISHLCCSISKEKNSHVFYHKLKYSLQTPREAFG